MVNQATVGSVVVECSPGMQEVGGLVKENIREN